MKRFSKVALIVLVVALLAAMMAVVAVASNGVATLNGTNMPTFGDAFGLAKDGDIIELKAQPEEPIKITSAVTVKAGEYDFRWYSDLYSAEVDESTNTYTFAPAAATTSITWYVGYKANVGEIFWYTPGSTPFYQGAAVIGTYTADDNTFTHVGYVDNEGNDVEIPEFIGDEPNNYYFHCKYDPGTTPRFKVVAPDGTETLYYVSTDLEYASRYAPDGATIVLMSNLFKEYQAEDTSILRSIAVRVSGGNTLNFDFAGYNIISEYKLVMFLTSGYRTAEVDGVSVRVPSTLNIYSSKPGAFLSLGEKNTDGHGGCVANAESGSVVNIGDYGEYSGSNLSTYSACGVNIYSNAVVNIRGCSMYRMIKDWVGFLYLRSSNATLNIENARIFGVNRDIQIAFGNKNVVTNSKVACKNTLFATLALPDQAYSGNFIRYISDGCTATFESCVFDHIPFTVERYTKSTDPEVPKVSVTFDEYCSFDALPNLVNKDIYSFPTISSGEVAKAPKKINVSRFETDPIAYPTYNVGAAHDYTLAPYEETVGGRYRFTATGYQDRAVEIDWFYGNKTITEWWAKGEIPSPHSVGIPKDSEYIKYVVDNVVPVEDYHGFNIGIQRKYKIIYNYTLSDKFYVNVYIPKFEGVAVAKLMSRFTVADKVYTADAISAIKTTAVIDGVTYYKVVTPYEYSRVPAKINISFDLAGADLARTTFTESHSISIVDIADELAASANARIQASAEGFIYTVANAYIKEGLSVPAVYQEYIDTKLAPQKEEE